MTIELKDTINDDAKYEYRDFCSCVRNQIIDAYKTYFYLKALEKKCPNRKMLSWSKQEYIEFLIRCFQERFVLSINKLVVDSGAEKYCVKNLKSFIKQNLASFFDESSLALSKKENKLIESQIKKYRDRYIAHNLRNLNNLTLYISKIKPLLDEIRDYYNKLLIDDLLCEKIAITNNEISGLEQFCENGLCL